MQNIHGKEIDLLRTTVKVPGKAPAPPSHAGTKPGTSPGPTGWPWSGVARSWAGAQVRGC